jgi:hypothetical protein
LLRQRLHENIKLFLSAKGRRHTALRVARTMDERIRAAGLNQGAELAGKVAPDRTVTRGDILAEYTGYVCTSGELARAEELWSETSRYAFEVPNTGCGKGRQRPERQLLIEAGMRVECAPRHRAYPPRMR